MIFLFHNRSILYTMDLLSLFGAEKISWDHAEDLQRSAPDIIIWAAPVMFFFVLIEYIISRRQHKEYYEKKETMGSIAVGLGNVAIGSAIKLLLFYVLIWVYNLIPWRMELNWWTLDRKSTRLNSSHVKISYAVFCLKKK